MTGYDEFAQQRWAPEPDKSSRRTAFERDRARVVHSASLRRLAAKTQVVAPGSDDFVRNRLTHSLEVAQVGRELGKALGCDPDIVDAACLAHDLGHPPFGHNGEEVLDTIAAKIGGFEGNAQTLRLLTRLEAKTVHPDGRSAGLNLTRATLDAVTKYPWRRLPGQAKFGVYGDDREVFMWMRQGRNEERCLEAQVMDFSDDVAYCVHDVEDAVVGGRIRISADGIDEERVAALAKEWYLTDASSEEIREGLQRLRRLDYWLDSYDGSRRALAGLKDMTSQLIGRFCHAAERATHDIYGKGVLTRYAAALEVPRECRVEIAALKGLAAVYVMTADDRAPLYGRQQELLYELAHALGQHAPEALDPTFQLDWHDAADDDARLRVVVDQVAGLTDASAYSLHAQLAERGAT